MMRVGKRGLNLAANAAVTAAAKVRWGQTQAPRTPPRSCHAPGQAPLQLLCPRCRDGLGLLQLRLPGLALLASSYVISTPRANLLLCPKGRCGPRLSALL